MLSCLLTPFKGVNTEAIGLYAIIFDTLYGSLILSSPLFTLDIMYIEYNIAIQIFLFSYLHAVRMYITLIAHWYVGV